VEIITDATLFFVVGLVLINVWSCIGVAVTVLLDTGLDCDPPPRPLDYLIMVIFWPVFGFIRLASRIEKELDQW